jgi:hypothetical protein
MLQLKAGRIQLVEKELSSILAIIIGKAISAKLLRFNALGEAKARDS